MEVCEAYTGLQQCGTAASLQEWWQHEPGLPFVSGHVCLQKRPRAPRHQHAEVHVLAQHDLHADRHDL